MAKYDYGGGCPCGLYRECIPGCTNAPTVTKKICTCGPNGYCSCDDKPKKRKKKVEKDIGDFGFTMLDEEQFRAYSNDKAYKLRDMILPLLNNLKGSPDKDYIQWPAATRVDQINAFIKKMNALVDG